MMPMYFGERRQCYGVYHSASGNGDCGRALLVCSPSANELTMAQRPLRMLADAFARNRWHVLRFDYAGTGNSAGNDVCVNQCVADAETALDELKCLAGVERASVLGLRFGADIALRLCATRDDVTKVVLWEPLGHLEIPTELRARAWVIVREMSPGSARVVQSMAHLRPTVSVVADPVCWAEERDFGTAPIPINTIRTLADWAPATK